MLDVLFEKHAFSERWAEAQDDATNRLEALRELLLAAAPEQVHGLLAEVVATAPYLRDGAVNEWGDAREGYQVRWHDLVACLTLDKYMIRQGDRSSELVAIEPDLQGAGNVEDALVAEIRRSGLPTSQAIVTLLDQSAAAFVQSPPKYNDCLTNARVALETITKQIGLARHKTRPSIDSGSVKLDKFGGALDYLYTSDLVTKREEELISAVYGFISAGAHRHVGLSEEEMARLGRGMAVSTGYFLIKLHNGSG